MLAEYRGRGASVALATFARVRDAIERELAATPDTALLRAATGDRAPRSDPRRPVGGPPRARHPLRRPGASSSARRSPSSGRRGSLTLIGPGGAGRAAWPSSSPERWRRRGCAEVHLVSLARDCRRAGSVTRLIADGLDVRERRGEPLIAGILSRLRNQRVLLVLDNCEHVLGTVAGLCQRIARGGARAADPRHEPRTARGSRARSHGPSRVSGSPARARRAADSLAAESMQLLAGSGGGGAAGVRPVRPGGRACRRRSAAGWTACRSRSSWPRRGCAASRSRPSSSGSKGTWTSRRSRRRHPGAPPDDARRDRLELRPPRRRRAPDASPAGGLPWRRRPLGRRWPSGATRSGADILRSAEPPRRPVDGRRLARSGRPVVATGCSRRSASTPRSGWRRPAEVTATRTMHAAWCARLVEAGRDWGGAEQETWLVRLGEAHADLLASPDVVPGRGRRPGRRARDDGEPVVVLVCPRPRGRGPRLAAADPRGVGDDGVGHPCRARSAGASALARSSGDYAEAIRTGEAGLAMCRELDDRQGVAGSLNSLSATALAMGRVDDAVRYGQESLDEVRGSDNGRGLGGVADEPGHGPTEPGPLRRCRCRAPRGDAVFRAVGDVRGETSAIINRAIRRAAPRPAAGGPRVLRRSPAAVRRARTRRGPGRLPGRRRGDRRRRRVATPRVFACS